MVSRIQVDPKEFIKFVKENNKLDPYELGKKYNMSLSSMMRFLSKYGFIRIRTSEGMRYVLEAEIAQPKKEAPQPAPEKPKADYSYDPKESYEDVVEYGFFSKEPIQNLRMDVGRRMKALGAELDSLNKEVAKNGYSDKISEGNKQKITIEIPSGFIVTLNSARFSRASALAKKKPIEEWTVDECLKFMNMENWLISCAYKQAVATLLRDTDPDKLSVVPCVEGFKKYSKHPAQG